MPIIIFLLFLLVPIMEIYVLFKVSAAIGFINAILLCILTAFVGTFLVRAQGIKNLISLRSSVLSLGMPLDEIYTGICLLMAGAFLITPGFLTDIVGFSLLIPPIRNAYKDFLLTKLQSRVNIHTQTYEQPANNNVIDGEFEHIQPDEINKD